jgi:hypothetical protein
MSGGQIAALVIAILLLFPGGCFLLVGFAVATERQIADIAWLPLSIAAAILGASGLLFWVALHRRRSSAPPTAAPE